jgi:hypothetical protein
MFMTVRKYLGAQLGMSALTILIPQPGLQRRGISPKQRVAQAVKERRHGFNDKSTVF